MLRNLEIVPSTESWTELLDWLNRSMPIEAPNHNKTPTMRKVEDCGHGVPYVLMLPSMLPIIHTPLLTSRVKVPAKTDFEAVANLKIMHDALRRNGIVIPDVLAYSSQKLVNRNFQANLQLLQWFRGLYIALQQCGIEAGEGRIILEASNAEDSISSLGSPPASVVRAEDRRRAESVQQTKPDSEVMREVRAAGSQGDAAAAAAAALLSEQRSLSNNRSQSRTSAFESTTLISARSGLYPVHHQQMPEVLQPLAPRQSRHESASSSRLEAQQPTDSFHTKSSRSPLPGPPLMEARVATVATAPAPPPPAVKHVAKPAAPPSQPRRILEHQTNSAERKDTRTIATTETAPVAEELRAPTPNARPTKSNVALRRGSPASRPPSASAAAATTGVSGNRTPHRREPSTPSTRARTPATGRSAFVFKPIPVRLSMSSSATRRTSTKGGSTPRESGVASSAPQSATQGGRRAATPQRNGAADRVAGAPTNGNGAARQPVGRRSKAGAKPVIALSTVPPPPSSPPVAKTQALAEAAPSAPAPAPSAGGAHEETAAIPSAPPSAPTTDGDVLQLQIDRQFYYDKLRTIEELVDCMEAKKKQERANSAKGWDAKDAEMMEFTQSVRSVLYAES